MPQPAEHCVQMLGLQTATPGIKFSSGIKRMSCVPCLPQPSKAKAAPLMADSFRKSRRFMVSELQHSFSRIDNQPPREVDFLVVTRSAIDRCPLRLVAADAKVHGQVLRLYSDRLL